MVERTKRSFVAWGKLKMGPTAAETERAIKLGWTGTHLNLHLIKNEDGMVDPHGGRSHDVTVQIRPDEARKLAIEILELSDNGRTIKVSDLLPLIRSANK